MNIKTHKSQIKIIRQNDPRFEIRDGITFSPRAGFEISPGCPLEYKQILAECINNGWLRPVAYMTEREMIFTGLAND